MDVYLSWNKYYDLHLTEKEIQNEKHKQEVGGNWEGIGKLQFQFLVKNGLLPTHKFLDIACGSLRGGIHFIDYLHPGHYKGLDINHSLIKAGQLEIKKANLINKKPILLVDDQFTFTKFHTRFDFAIAHSLFTHLPINLIWRCLINVEKVLKIDGKIYATFFESKNKFTLDPIKQYPRIITNFDRDPFHYHLSVFEYMVKDSSLDLEYDARLKSRHRLL